MPNSCNLRHFLETRSFSQLPPEPVLIHKVVPDSWAQNAGFEGGFLAKQIVNVEGGFGEAKRNGKHLVKL